MIQHLRVFRVNGDSLSCWFSPGGSLSSALLSVEGTQYDVSGQLPGLIEGNAEEYLTELGYSKSHAPGVARVGSSLNARLRDSSLFLEAVKVSRTSIVLSLALREDRSYACCRRALVALCNRQSAEITCTACRNLQLQEEFSALLRKPSQ